IFPSVDTGQFQLRLRAPAGKRIEHTEKLTQRVLAEIEEEIGNGNIAKSICYVGAIAPSYPINNIYLWTSGSQDAVMRIALKHGAGPGLERLMERLRDRLARAMPGVQFSFEAGDIVSEVLSLGSPTPIEIAVSGPNLAANRAHAEAIEKSLAAIPRLRDLQFGQVLDYPTLDVTLDRARAGFSGVSASEVARSMVAATSSSRFTVPSYWADPRSGIGYQVQIEVPQARMDSVEAIRTVPVKETDQGDVLLRDVADVRSSAMPGEYDRYNMQRMVTLQSNIIGEDLAAASAEISKALRKTAQPPAGVNVTVRGEIPLLQQMTRGLSMGLLLAIFVILLLLAAYFESFALALVVISSIPAVLAGVGLALFVTGTALSVQSFLGAIMAVGVAVANAILLVTFAEQDRRSGKSARDAALSGAKGRLRAIVMTSAAMIVGMIPTALGLGETGEQVGPLGRAVIGGLIAATLATLFVVPCVFAVVQANRATTSPSLDPDDPESLYSSARTAMEPGVTP
ncbi:MAG TPA: efflux RND transporter permease subunit, partial [Phycisphaerae bacterium]|nr:efflux RND transporter permease subunit [Phycisphaerae bacterium]